MIDRLALHPEKRRGVLIFGRLVGTWIMLLVLLRLFTDRKVFRLLFLLKTLD